LRHIIEKRIGMEHFSDKLSQLAKHESYSHAAKKPQLTCKQPSEVIFDFEFTILFKRLESKSVVSFGICICIILSSDVNNKHVVKNSSSLTLFSFIERKDCFFFNFFCISVFLFQKVLAGRVLI